jgi:hypothetical protein
MWKKISSGMVSSAIISCGIIAPEVERSNCAPITSGFSPRILQSHSEAFDIIFTPMHRLNFGLLVTFE